MTQEENTTFILPRKSFNIFHALRLVGAFSKAFYYDFLLGIKITPGDIYLIDDRSRFKDMTHCRPAFYGRLEKIAGQLQLSAEDIFVDLGCGEGRAVCFMARLPIKRSIGVELDADIFSRARQNALRMWGRKAEIEIINQDASLFESDEGTVFYIYNSFGKRTLETVMENIENSLKRNARKVRIVYYSPIHSEVLDGLAWLHREGVIENAGCIVWANGENVFRNKDFLLEYFDLKEAFLGGDLFTFRSEGLCMYPCFKNGDKVTVKSRKPEEFAVGDIAVFRRSGNLYAHRVIRTAVAQEGPYIVTRPDAFFCKDDGFIFGRDILGVVTRVERNGELIIGLKNDRHWIKKPAVFMYLLWRHFVHQLAFLAKKTFFGKER